MFYRVTAALNTEFAADFLQKLTDGTIQNQRPDGAEIVDSMNRAVITDNGGRPVQQHVFLFHSAGSRTGDGVRQAFSGHEDRTDRRVSKIRRPPFHGTLARARRELPDIIGAAVFAWRPAHRPLKSTGSRLFQSPAYTPCVQCS